MILNILLEDGATSGINRINRMYPLEFLQDFLKTKQSCHRVVATHSSGCKEAQVNALSNPASFVLEILQLKAMVAVLLLGRVRTVFCCSLQMSACVNTFLLNGWHDEGKEGYAKQTLLPRFPRSKWCTIRKCMIASIVASAGKVCFTYANTAQNFNLIIISWSLY